jgi:hypothetical protein
MEGREKPYMKNAGKLSMQSSLTFHGGLGAKTPPKSKNMGTMIAPPLQCFNIFSVVFITSI